ncbi:MAG: (Fe-S)-binding protein [Opitutaceae bacterium]|nr:(Fe-S)-binding protein [Opitutaceae bacterium]
MVNLKRKSLSGKKVQLMATCLCDAFFDDVAKATVEVLEYLGCEVIFPEGQTCCGQPAFNGGDWASSRKVVRHTVEVFEGAEPVIIPSGSCAAMLQHGAALEFEKETDKDQVDELASRSWELTDYIVNGLGMKEWPGTFAGKVAFHRSCHTRGSCSGEATLTLLNSIEGVEIVSFGGDEECCGFGGTFSVSFPNTSEGMGQIKIAHVLESKPDVLVSGDMGCLMHLGGLVDRHDKELKRMHVVQILRDALLNGGLMEA